MTRSFISIGLRPNEELREVVDGSTPGPSQHFFCNPMSFLQLLEKMRPNCQDATSFTKFEITDAPARFERQIDEWIMPAIKLHRYDSDVQVMRQGQLTVYPNQPKNSSYVEELLGLEQTNSGGEIDARELFCLFANPPPISEILDPESTSERWEVVRESLLRPEDYNNPETCKRLKGLMQSFEIALNARLGLFGLAALGGESAIRAHAPRINKLRRHFSPEFFFNLPAEYLAQIHVIEALELGLSLKFPNSGFEFSRLEELCRPTKPLKKDLLSCYWMGSAYLVTREDSQFASFFCQWTHSCSDEEVQSILDSLKAEMTWTRWEDDSSVAVLFKAEFHLWDSRFDMNQYRIAHFYYDMIQGIGTYIDHVLTKGCESQCKGRCHKLVKFCEDWGTEMLGGQDGAPPNAG